MKYVEYHPVEKEKESQPFMGCLSLVLFIFLIGYILLMAHSFGNVFNQMRDDIKALKNEVQALKKGAAKP